MSSPIESETQSRTNDLLEPSIWYRKVYALCQAKLISRTDAEDAAQETFARAFAQQNLRSSTSMGAWLRGIAHNVCVDTIRRNRVRQTSGQSVDTIEATEQPAPAATAKQLEAAIGQLPEPLREVVLLHYYEDMTYDQMATWLDIARSTVSERLSRARTTLKRSLQ